MPPDDPGEFRLPLSDRVAEPDRGTPLPLQPPDVTIPLAPPEPTSRSRSRSRQPELRHFAADELLALVVATGSSDLHLQAGLPPQLRRAGRLEAVGGHAPLAIDDVRRCLGYLLEGEHWERIDRGLTLNVVRPVDGLARFRVNAFPTARGLAAVLHVIPWDVPGMADLGLPASVSGLATLPSGLVLVGGASGSGRSTTMAALLRAAMESRAGHAMTIEGPIEFVHDDGSGVVSQRDVGPEALARAVALRETDRQDADIVLVDDVDDIDVLTEALAVAASGRLVFGAVRERTATAVIESVVLGFPRDRRPWARRQLADHLRAVVCQALCRRSDGSGLVPATDVLHMNAELSKAVHDGDLERIASAMAAGSEAGTHSLDQDLADLVDRGEVSVDEARRHTREPGGFDT